MDILKIGPAEVLPLPSKFSASIIMGFTPTSQRCVLAPAPAAFPSQTPPGPQRRRPRSTIRSRRRRRAVWSLPALVDPPADGLAPTSGPVPPPLRSSSLLSPLVVLRVSPRPCVLVDGVDGQAGRFGRSGGPKGPSSGGVPSLWRRRGREVLLPPSGADWRSSSPGRPPALLQDGARGDGLRDRRPPLPQVVREGLQSRGAQDVGGLGVDPGLAAFARAHPREPPRALDVEALEAGEVGARKHPRLAAVQ